MAEKFDLIVIGGGSGGSACARRAAGYGAKVVLIERGALRDERGVRIGAGVGGTCVNVGCVPKKLMYNAAAYREQVVGDHNLARSYGFSPGQEAGQLDWKALKSKRDAYVGRLNKIYKNNWEKAGIEVVIGTGEFQDAHTVSVALSETPGKSRTFTAPHVVIAAGGEANVPSFPGVEHTISSDGVFDLEEQPKKIAVVGSGYIGIEMAGIFHALGSETDLIFRGEKLLNPLFDEFIRDSLHDQIDTHGPKLRCCVRPNGFAKREDGTIAVLTEEGTAFEGYDCVLLAIGRKPLTRHLHLERAGVKTLESGHIPVDDFENTNVGGIYAIGDINDKHYDLTPVAVATGRRLSDRLFGGEPRARIEYGTIATVVFSHPPIGMIGLTEDMAVKEYGKENVRCVQARFASMLYAFSEDDAKVKTALKLVMVGPEERIVGLHMMGPFTDEMIQGFAVAVRMGATRADFEASVAIHPTIAEEVVTMSAWGQKKQKDGSAVPVLPPFLKEEEDRQPPKPAPPASNATTLAIGLVVGASLGVASMVLLRGSKL